MELPASVHPSGGGAGRRAPPGLAWKRTFAYFLFAAARKALATAWHPAIEEDAAEILFPAALHAWPAISLAAVLVWFPGLLLALARPRRRGRLSRRQDGPEVESASLAGNYEHLVRQANDIIVLVGPDWRIVDANERAAQAYGCTREELIGKHAGDLHPPATRERFAEKVLEIDLDNGSVVETEHMRNDGTVFPVEISARAFEAGGKRFYQGIIRDISGRKRVEDELRSSEEMYRLLFRHTPIGIFHYDLGLVVTNCNDRFVEILQSKRERIIGLDLNQLHDRSPLPSIRAGAAGFEGFYEGPYSPTTSEAYVYFSMRTTPLRDREGAVIGGVGIVEDISERKRVEAELRSSEERYRQLFKFSPVGVFQYDLDLVVTDCNDLFTQIARSVRDNIVGLNLHGLRDKRILPALRGALDGKPGRYEGPYRASASDKERWVSLLTAPLIGDHGEVAGAIATLEDVSERYALQSQLAERELFLRRLTDNMLDLISQIDTKGNLVYLSPSHERVLGYREGELPGRNVMELVHPDDLAMVAKAYERSYRELAPGAVEFRARRADGSYIWMESVGNPLFDEEGKLIGAIFVTRDISDRKRAEEELERSRKMISSAFETVPATVMLLARDYSVRFANSYFRSIFGNAEGRRCYESMYGLEGPCEGCEVLDVLEMDIPRTKERTVPGGKCFLVHYYPFEDEQGERMVLEMGIDVTERKLAEWRVERLNRCFLELGADPLENIVNIVDAGMEILGAEAMHYSRLDRGMFQVYHTLSVGRGFRPLDEERHTLCRAVIAEGREQPVLVTDLDAGEYAGLVPEVAAEGLKSYLGYPVRAHDRTVGIIGMLRGEKGGFSGEQMDFMGLLARAVAVEEERLAHEEELRNFIDIASHELRHPMTIIKGYSSTLLAHQDCLDEKTKNETLMDIVTGVDRLEKLILQLLDTARIERRKLHLEKKHANLELVAENAVEEMSLRVPDARISLRILGEPTPRYADPERLGQVFIILIENALNHSTPGNPVEVELSFVENGGLTVSVLDRGPGVPEADRERIFERFFQVGDPQHHSTRGIGLGLYIARDIVETHGGRIWHEPRPGGGSAFRFTLP